MTSKRTTEEVDDEVSRAADEAISAAEAFGRQREHVSLFRPMLIRLLRSSTTAGARATPPAAASEQDTRSPKNDARFDQRLPARRDGFATSAYWFSAKTLPIAAAKNTSKK